MTIAVLGKPRGIRGEIHAFSFSDHPERFALLSHVYLDGKRYAVEDVWFHLGALVFKFAGVDSIDEAEPLAKCEVRIPFSERAPLDGGEFYQSDLMGCEVRERGSNRVVGLVTGFEEGGSSGLLQVGSKILIPFSRDICVSIAPERREILVDLPEGLLELNQ